MKKPKERQNPVKAKRKAIERARIRGDRIHWFEIRVTIKNQKPFKLTGYPNRKSAGKHLAFIRSAIPRPSIIRYVWNDILIFRNREKIKVIYSIEKSKALPRVKKKDGKEIEQNIQADYVSICKAKNVKPDLALNPKVKSMADLCAHDPDSKDNPSIFAKDKQRNKITNKDSN